MHELNEGYAFNKSGLGIFLGYLCVKNMLDFYQKNMFHSGWFDKVFGDASSYLGRERERERKEEEEGKNIINVN